MQPSQECLHNHVAARVKDCIVLFSTFSNKGNLSHEIWTYNLWSDHWKKFTLPKGKQFPAETTGKGGVAIESDVYMLDGRSYSGILWKLTRRPDCRFEWSTIVKGCSEKPSPRLCCGCWEYEQRVWMFGGIGTESSGYLNDQGKILGEGFFLNNQLLCYYPSIQIWINPQCFGDIPCPRYSAAVACINDKVWLFGGIKYVRSGLLYLERSCDDLYELDMKSLVWTQIETGKPKPSGPFPYMPYSSMAPMQTLTPIRLNQLVLHSNCIKALQSTSRSEVSTWILDLQTHTWRKHPVSDVECTNGHTGITGLNSEVLIIGGHVRNTYSNNPISSVVLEPSPKKLQQLSTKTIYRCREELPWNDLAQTLIRRIMGFEAEFV